MPEPDGPRISPGGEHTTPSSLAFLNIAFLAIAAYNTFELLIWIFHFFKRRRGLYFWSILTCTISIALFTLTSFLQYFRLAPFAFTGVAIAIAFPSLLAAQSLILYSRLHLISTPGALLRFIFWGIIITSILFLTPFAINLIGLAAGNTAFAPPQHYLERFLVTGTVVREVLICGVYLWQAVRQLRPIIELKGTAGHRVMVHIILSNTAVIILDMFTLLALYQGRSGLGSAYTCVSHSVKLRMEFVVLPSIVGSRILVDAGKCMICYCRSRAAIERPCSLPKGRVRGRRSVEFSFFPLRPISAKNTPSNRTMYTA